MLVLNRHLGESIIIEGGITITVLSAKDRTVWLKIESEELTPPLVVGALDTSSVSMRLSIGSPLSMVPDGTGFHFELAGMSHPSRNSQAMVSVNCRSGQVVSVGKSVLSVKATEHEHPNLVLSGEPLGGEISLAFIRPVGSWIRLGVDAPTRRVYRRELWEELAAANAAANTEEDDFFGSSPRLEPGGFLAQAARVPSGDSTLVLSAPLDEHATASQYL